jgi:hypothetical protein
VGRLVIAVVLLAGLWLLARIVPIEPIERRPGLGLSAPVGTYGDATMAAVDGRIEVHLETSPWYGIPHSVTTILWRDGEFLYIPCANCPAKNWPGIVATDPDVRVKINGSLYALRMQKIEDDAVRRQLLRVLGGADAPPDVWVYRLLPR